MTNLPENLLKLMDAKLSCTYSTRESTHRIGVLDIATQDSAEGIIKKKKDKNPRYERYDFF